MSVQREVPRQPTAVWAAGATGSIPRLSTHGHPFPPSPGCGRCQHTQLSPQLSSFIVFTGEAVTQNEFLMDEFIAAELVLGFKQISALDDNNAPESYFNMCELDQDIKRLQ